MAWHPRFDVGCPRRWHRELVSVLGNTYASAYHRVLIARGAGLVVVVVVVERYGECDSIDRNFPSCMTV